jgi:ribosome-binding factor A
MPREFSRSDRVASQIQKELAELIRTHVRDPDLGLVTVSDVEMTRDLSVATLYVTFLAAKRTPAECVKQLAEHGPELRRELGKHLRIRVLPEIRFVYDESIERGMRMDELLNRLSHEGHPEDGRHEDES